MREEQRVEDGGGLTKYAPGEKREATIRESQTSRGAWRSVMSYDTGYCTRGE